jgi:hypothetical protein
MSEFIAAHALGSLWALAWHFTGIGVVIAAALAYAFLTPAIWPGKKTALWVAACATFIFFTAAMYTKLGADHVQEKWDASNVAAVVRGNGTRARATRDVARGVRDSRDLDN